MVEKLEANLRKLQLDSSLALHWDGVRAPQPHKTVKELELDMYIVETDGQAWKTLLSIGWMGPNNDQQIIQVNGNATSPQRHSSYSIFDGVYLQANSSSPRSSKSRAGQLLDK
jgi:hypothetical protein